MKKTILITGATRGIGREIARKFHREGFQVIICARGADALKELEQEMPGLIGYTCDLSQKESVVALAQTINQDHAPLEVLVNNGGAYLPGLIYEEEDEVFETLMATNIYSAYYLTKRLLPHMIEQKRGMVINISSIAGITAYPNSNAYSISKFAMQGFTRILRDELRKYSIRVVGILPGAVKTSAWDGVEIPESQFIPSEDIAEMVWMSYQMSPRTTIEEIIVRPTPGDIGTY